VQNEMSAMGQKQTFAAQDRMSASLPKADIHSAKEISAKACSKHSGQLGDELHIFFKRPNAASAGADIA
jgi:hypothetical protein